MLFFTTRQAARNFAMSKGRKVTDFGANAVKRWAVRVL